VSSQATGRGGAGTMPAGAVSTVFSFPLDTLRTRMSLPGAGSIITEPINIFRTLGLKGFYQVDLKSGLCTAFAVALMPSLLVLMR
jgi:hypothetical protein